MRKRLAALERGLARVERAPVPEALHELRIASRRLRAALRHLGPCLPREPAKTVREAASHVARLMGEARDLDILIENVAPSAGRKGSPLALLLKRFEAQRQKKLKKALGPARLLRRRLPGWERRLAG